MGSNIDLRKYQEEEALQEAFSKVVSGKSGYKTIIERKKIPPKCIQCGRGGDQEQKFCAQCGGKMKIPLTHCPGCKRMIEDIEKFCTECGHDLAAARAR
ncbi:MAG: zinc ribbon domain-containing protein [Nanoarchaeota archaeon]